MKPVYHAPFPYLEEKMRWRNLWPYDAWVRRQTLPEGGVSFIAPWALVLRS